MGKFQNILALDTAMAGCTAAVVAGEFEAVRSEAMPRGQAEHLVPFAQEVMEQAGLDYADLDAVLCTVGPGAFTGLRIGMSAARAYGLSLEIPIFGITTTQALALAFSAEQKKSCAVIIETKRSDFYIQLFDETGKAISEATAAEAADIEIPEGFVLIGDGVRRFLEMTGLENETELTNYMLPDMLACARCLAENYNVEGVFHLNPEPVYLRGADVSQPKSPPRQLEDIK